MARGVFWISMKMRFVRMAVFRDREHISSGNRLPMWLFPKRGRGRGMAKSEKNIFCRKHEPGMAGDIFRAIICWGLRIGAGWRPATLAQSPELSKTENQIFDRNWGHPKSFSSRMFIICKKGVYSSGKEWNRC